MMTFRTLFPLNHLTLCGLLLGTALSWNAFAASLDIQLTPNREAIERWWTSVASAVQA